VSYLPGATRDNYKSVTAYFPRFDWNLVIRISERTGRGKTELIREALEEYLGSHYESRLAWFYVDRRHAGATMRNTS